AVWITAAESGLNWESGTFFRAYRKNRGEAVELGFEASPIASEIRALVEGSPRWEGTAKDLLTFVIEKKTDAEQRSRTFPQTPQAISNHLRRLAPGFRTLGIEIAFRRQASQRLITIEKVTENLVTSVTEVSTRLDHDQEVRHEPDPMGRGDEGDTCDDQNQVVSGEGFPREIPHLGKIQRGGVSRCKRCPAP